METEEEEHKAKKAEQAQMEIAKFQIRVRLSVFVQCHRLSTS